MPSLTALCSPRAHLVVDGHPRLEIAYTKPAVVAFAGAPPFKTQKLLGSRTVVTDSFSKTTTPLPTPGMGQWAHREGYNLLRGDGSAAWYGDPQKTLIWWQGAAKNNNVSEDDTWVTMAMTLSVNGIVEGFYPEIAKTSANSLPGQEGYMYLNAPGKSSVTAWHQFDAAQGIDLP
ncbi:MAG TPA: hypothetical protein P5137_05105 [Candidatus Brocadiia bacterium]|nr:hypothetical protein [Candidatus Brocadiia bacterium]